MVARARSMTASGSLSASNQAIPAAAPMEAVTVAQKADSFGK